MLETLNRADTFVFDKSGTLTHGSPAVNGIEGDWPPDQLLRLAASLERASAHPYAQAIVREAGVRSLQLLHAERLDERPGRGIAGTVEGMQVVVGSASWLLSQGILPPANARIASADMRSSSDSVVHIAVNRRWAGLIRLQDRLREDAGTVVRTLSAYGEVWMATGDREQAASRIAAATGIRRVRAGLLPEHKLGLLQELRGRGRRVVMVGDGANDSAALAAADVGIALASGHAAALETGDIVIVGGRLSQVGEIYKLARRTMRNIRQNLLIALLYNAVMIPLAVAGLLDPRVACVGMASSSLLVVGNAARLRRAAAGRRRRRPA
ncbi:Copper-transporting P-type ATPase [Cohnella sp. JJ-181]|nr:HAD-IC family P-type ATPase [Cohnella sp. JJ-181]CAI6034765.1 Copper-transporting P-type ATPase [Cohnella sp. JJ-181]